MSEELNSSGDAGTGAAPASSPAEAAPIDEHTTEPNAPERPRTSASADGKWQMPKPKFQQTSGYLPQGYLEDMQRAAAAAKASSGSEDTTREQDPFVPDTIPPPTPAAAAPSPLAIEPQPDLADQLIPEEPVVMAPKPASKTTSGPTALMFALGILGMIVFVVIFIGAVWYFYSYGR